MPAIVHPSSTVCSTRASRVINLDLVNELQKSQVMLPGMKQIT